MLGHDLEMSCAKFQRNRFKNDGEIDKKHVFQILSWTVNQRQIVPLTLVLLNYLFLFFIHLMLELLMQYRQNYFFVCEK